MRKRSEVIPFRKRSEVATTKGAAGELERSSSLCCEACGEDNAPGTWTTRADGTPECNACGAPLAVRKAPDPKDDLESIPDPKTRPGPSTGEQSPVPKPDLPKVYCDQCGAEWPRVNERPFPNCGHSEGFVNDPTKAKRHHPPAGHPRPAPREDAPTTTLAEKWQATVEAHNASAPVVTNVIQNGFLRIEWGKSVFAISGYGVNMTVGGFSLSVESPPNTDVAAQGAAALGDLRKLADRAFDEQLSWYLEKLSVLEKKFK